MKALDIAQVTFSYNPKEGKIKTAGAEYALRDFSMSVDSGQMHALLGPNGAGKTTLMRLITGQLRGFQGSISIYGTRSDHAQSLSSVGYAPQPISVYAGLTAMENMRVFGVMAGLSRELLQERSRAVLEETGLLPYAQKRASTYSGGMLRRLNLAVALLHAPRLLLLDEPTVGVDPQSRNHIYETLKKMNASGIAIVLCTHIMDEAQRMCSKVTMLDRGAVIFSGAMNEIDHLETFFLAQTGHRLRDED